MTGRLFIIYRRLLPHLLSRTYQRESDSAIRVSTYFWKRFHESKNKVTLPALEAL